MSIIVPTSGDTVIDGVIIFQIMYEPDIPLLKFHFYPFAIFLNGEQPNSSTPWTNLKIIYIFQRNILVASLDHMHSCCPIHVNGVMDRNNGACFQR